MGGGGGIGSGGGVACSTNCAFDYVSIGADNASGGAGGSSSSVTAGNGGDGRGGGLYARAANNPIVQTLTWATVSGNAVDGGILGGGTAAPGSAIGGGIDVDGAPLQVSYSLIAANQAGVANSTTTDEGGGVAYSTQASSSWELVNDTITENTAGFASANGGQGGGVYLGASNGTQALLASSTVANNTADGNASAAGGNLFASGNPLGLTGTIVAGGIVPVGTGSNCATASGGSFTDDGYNLEDTTPSQCGLTSQSSIVGESPMLGALASNGGPTDTLAISSSSSPAVDAGGPAGAPCTDATGAPIATDQRGVARGEPCDIGAFELSEPPRNSAAPTVSGAAETNMQLNCAPGTWGGGDPSTPAYTYAWLRDGVAMSGETTSSYLVTAGDAGHQIACKVTAANDDGSNSATSEAATILTLTSPANGLETNHSTLMVSGGAGVEPNDGASVMVKIYAGSTVSGSPVQTDSAQVTAGTGAYSLNVSVPNGTYTAQATQTLGAGPSLISVSAATTFTVDATLPGVTIDTPRTGSVIANTTPTFSGAAGTGADDLPAITVKIYDGSSATGSPVETLMTGASSGFWSVQASSALALGTYTAQVSQSDMAGDTGAGTTTFTVAAVPSCHPASVSAISGKMLQIRLNCSTVLGFANTYVFRSVPSHGGLYGIGPTVSYMSKTGYVGRDSFSYDALNAAGSSSIVTISINVGLPRPTIGQLRQAHKSWTESAGTTFSFVLNESARITLSFQRKGAKGNPTKLSFAGRSGRNSFRFNGHISRGPQLKPGNYTVVVTASNPSGAAAKPGHLSFTILP
jgi:hypothetical protein